VAAAKTSTATRALPVCCAPRCPGRLSRRRQAAAGRQSPRSPSAPHSASDRFHPRSKRAPKGPYSFLGPRIATAHGHRCEPARAHQAHQARSAERKWGWRKFHGRVGVYILKNRPTRGRPFSRSENRLDSSSALKRGTHPVGDDIAGSGLPVAAEEGLWFRSPGRQFMRRSRDSAV
jgi:hypothetical protein